VSEPKISSFGKWLDNADVTSYKLKPVWQKDEKPYKLDLL
jgi:hypothetical protein